ncbi:Uncharacterised protein [uncultured Clostridium sp.]|nr:Uncharacterised protein [uncultured Clostridium sp.]SCJ52542.1 Uncharacterised protein [uncultured Clostridium sp.]
MEKVNKKEIRIIYNLENEKDKEIYQKILKLSKTQPGRVAKRIIAENIDNEESNQNTNNINLKLLNVLDKLCDKIDNLKVAETTDSANNNNNDDNEDHTKNSISFTQKVEVNDIDDITF